MTDIVNEVVSRSVPPGKEVLLSLRDLHAGFETDDGRVQAVDGVSFDVARGEVFAIVGESGSGKSVTAMSILGLQPTLDITAGEILWKGRDLLTLPEEERRQIRGKEIAMIFQDPLTSLNPVHSVGNQIGEMARIHEGLGKKAAFERAVEMLDLVGIPEPRERARGGSGGPGGSFSRSRPPPPPGVSPQPSPASTTWATSRSCRSPGRHRR